jgi:hypothetical protein
MTTEMSNFSQRVLNLSNACFIASKGSVRFFHTHTFTAFGLNRHMYIYTSISSTTLMIIVGDSSVIPVCCTAMSQPSVSTPSAATQGSPAKRRRTDQQLIAPSYIRMQMLSFCIQLTSLRCSFINPKDERSIAKGIKDVLQKVYDKAVVAGFSMQQRECAEADEYGLMAGVLLVCYTSST